MIKWQFFIFLYFIVNTGSLNVKTTENADWKLLRSSNQISIYARSVDYSNYKELKGEMIVKHKPDVIVSFLQNIDSFKEWLPGCLDSKKLNQISATEQINYILTDVPWPYNNRDLVYQFTIVTKNHIPGQIKILIENKPEYIPFKKSIVRVPKTAGFWTITPVGENQTKLEYQIHLEPGGFVPAWLVNMKMDDSPYAFLYNLREQVEKK